MDGQADTTVELQYIKDLSQPLSFLHACVEGALKVGGWVSYFAVILLRVEQCKLHAWHSFVHTIGYSSRQVEHFLVDN